MFRHILSVFRKDDRGQDLAEYCLIIAFGSLLAVGVYGYLSGGMQNLWGAANTSLAAGTTASGAAGGAGGAAAASAGAGSH